MIRGTYRADRSGALVCYRVGVRVVVFFVKAVEA